MNRLLLVLCFFSGAAMAQVTYDYTGNPLTDETVSGSPGANAPQSLSGDIVLAQALNGNEADQVVVPLSYAFNNNLTSAFLAAGTDAEVWSGTASFEFSTANGVLTGWDISISHALDNGFSISSSTSLNLMNANGIGGDSFSTSQTAIDCGGFNPPPGCNYSVMASNSSPGTMVDPPGQSLSLAKAAPQIDPGSAAAALTLLLGSIAVMLARSKRSTRHHVT